MRLCGRALRVEAWLPREASGQRAWSDGPSLGMWSKTWRSSFPWWRRTLKRFSEKDTTHQVRIPSLFSDNSKRSLLFTLLFLKLEWLRVAAMSVSFLFTSQWIHFYRRLFSFCSTGDQQVMDMLSFLYGAYREPLWQDLLSARCTSPASQVREDLKNATSSVPGAYKRTDVLMRVIDAVKETIADTSSVSPSSEFTNELCLLYASRVIGLTGFLLSAFRMLAAGCWGSSFDCVSQVCTQMAGTVVVLSPVPGLVKFSISISDPATSTSSNREKLGLFVLFSSL